MSADRQCGMVERDHPRLSVTRQCVLVGIGRSTFYRSPTPETAENLALMRKRPVSAAVEMVDAARQAARR